ncbi:MAG: hypothetical protein ACRDTE_15120 [Pseudonocardiaceae bacterium]
MLVRDDHAGSPEVADDSCHRQPLDAFAPDPSDVNPLCGEEEFATLLENMVADEAPRLFAVMQVYGERVDARIAAWGMAFQDRAEVVAVDRRLRMNLQAPENALRGFNLGRHMRARIVWFDPGAATPAEDVDGT